MEMKTQQINFEETIKDVKEIKNFVLEILKEKNPEEYYKYLKEKGEGI